MRILAVDPSEPREDRLEEAIATLQRGEAVALPTETFYGLAADSFSPEAVLRVNRIKDKPANAPLLLLLAEAAQAELVAENPAREFETLAQAFWPGALTLVVRARPEVPREVTGGLGTVALRVPGLALPRRLARGLGRPITGVSANLHGQPPARTAAEVLKVLEGRFELLLDGGTTLGAVPSTIVDLTTSPPRVLRRGLVPVPSVRNFLPELVDSPL